MDFNVNVKFDATPALVGAVATLATALSGCAAPQVQRTMVADGAVTFTPLPEQAKTDAPAPAIPGVQSPVTVPEAQPSTDISDTVVREAVSVKAKAGKKAEIKELLAEFGVKSSPELPQERRAEFIQKINAL